MFNQQPAPQLDLQAILTKLFGELEASNMINPASKMIDPMNSGGMRGGFQRRDGDIGTFGGQQQPTTGVSDIIAKLFGNLKTGG